MKRRAIRLPCRAGQRGVSGVLVIAALVLLGSLSAFGVSLVGGIHSSLAQEISLARADQAAQAGLEWARFQITRTPVAVCPALQTLVLPATLANHRATVRCTLSGTHTEAAATRRTYRVTVTACNAALCPGVANGDYVERQLVAWVIR